jgi:predicted O-methyltransferase YrrM
MLAQLRRVAGTGGFLCRRLLVDVLAAPERASAFRAAIGRLREAEYHEARIPVRRLTDLWPSPGQVTAAVDALAGGNPTAIELFCIGAVARATGARHIFEIGTFDGATTLQLALNSPPDALIYTLDLPADAIDHTRIPLLPQERAYALKPASGARFRGTPAQDKIRQLYGDSAAFSVEPFAGCIDLVVVDGSHARDYVRSDSALARVMVRRGGWIVWHDYGVWPDVTAGLDELAAEMPLVRLEATTLVVGRAPSNG